MYTEVPLFAEHSESNEVATEKLWATMSQYNQIDPKFIDSHYRPPGPKSQRLCPTT